MRSPRRVLTVLAAAALATGGAARAGDSAVGQSADLEQLPASPLLLKAPDGVNGDFDVAKEQPRIDFAYFPNQWEGARLWSSWGDALCASDESFYASVGDHGAPHGTAYVYRIGQDGRSVRLVVDFNAAIGVSDPEAYTPGKIHGGLVEGHDGGIYFFGYRGSEGKTTEAEGYRGDWLLRYDPRGDETTNLGIAVPHSSVPVLHYNAATRSLVGLAAPGKTAPEPANRLFRYGLEEETLVFHGGLDPNMARALILADDGRAWYSHRNAAGDDVFVRYEPGKSETVATTTRVPADGQLRAASQPDSSGVVYAITAKGRLFAFDTTKESVAELGDASAADPLYTAACRLDPTGRYLYYLPGAHGGTHRSGTPVVQFDTRTKRRKVVAFLNAYLREQQDYNAGGTYGIALSPDGARLLINLNGAPLGSKQPDFGRCAAVVLHIPESERPAD